GADFVARRRRVRRKPDNRDRAIGLEDLALRAHRDAPWDALLRPLAVSVACALADGKWPDGGSVAGGSRSADRSIPLSNTATSHSRTAVSTTRCPVGQPRTCSASGRYDEASATKRRASSESVVATMQLCEERRHANVQHSAGEYRYKAPVTL